MPWGQLSCRWYGNRQVRPILALHGMLDNMGTFAGLIPLLPDHVGVLCIDHPGLGRSSPYPDGIQHSLYAWVSVLRRVVRHFKWKRVSLMGHSIGGAACNLYASFYPENHVDLLIAIDVLSISYKTSSEYIKWIANSVERMLKPKPNPKLYTKQQLEKVRWGPAPSVSTENSQSLKDRSLHASPTDPEKFYFARDLRIVHYTSFPNGVELVREINRRIKNVPYLLIKASDSNFVRDTDLTVLAILRKQNPKFEYHLAEGDHYVHINDPKQLAAWITPFINRHRPAERWEDPGPVNVSKL